MHARKAVEFETEIKYFKYFAICPRSNIFIYDDSGDKIEEQINKKVSHTMSMRRILTFFSRCLKPKNFVMQVPFRKPMMDSQQAYSLAKTKDKMKLSRPRQFF